ncbi:NfeD family protein [Mycoplasmopsis edwardii]|uniref:NfeD family protein n=1 Tax=Mycoplasmopsis edwardii TaxID=53558 RepID=UPI000E3D2096|nr:hypothetical protein [Mycoplasmopsis edwardii]
MDSLRIVFIVLWSFIILLFFILEILTTGLWAGLTSFSAIPSLFISIFVKMSVSSIALQIIMFIISWVLLYLIIFKVFKNKFLNYKYKESNFNGIDKTEIFILEEDSYEEKSENNLYGAIKIGDKKFRTLSIKNEGLIKKGTQVTIKEIRGNILYIAATKEKDVNY